MIAMESPMDLLFEKDDGSIENVKGAYSLLDKLIKAIPQLQDAQLAVNPFKTLAKNVKELFTSEKDSDKLEKKIGRLGESAAESADLVGNFAGQMSSMFDALGNEGMADTMGNVQDAMSSISNIGQGFAKGGIVGGIAAAAGEAVNWIGKIAQAHDKKLDKAIEKVNFVLNSCSIYTNRLTVFLNVSWAVARN